MTPAPVTFERHIWQEHSQAFVERFPSNRQYLPQIDKSVLLLPRGVNLVRYQPTFRTSPKGKNRFSYLHWLTLFAVLIAGVYNLLKTSAYSSLIERLEADRIRSADIWISAINNQNIRMDSAYEEDRTFMHHLQTSTSNHDVRISLLERKDRERWKALAMLEQRLMAQQAPLVKANAGTATDEDFRTSSLSTTDTNEISEDIDGYHFDGTIALPPEIRLHRGKSGKADYWMARKPDTGSSISRVIPFATTALGVAVHCIDDDHEYIITNTGKWMKFGP